MRERSYQSLCISIIHIFLIFGWTHPYRVRKCIPHAILRKEIGFLEEQNLPWDFFPFLDQTCLASLRSADNSLIAESEKLSLGKFCSSSNPFLTMIAWRNKSSVWLESNGPGTEKFEGELYIPREELSFSEVVVEVNCQKPSIARF